MPTIGHKLVKPVQYHRHGLESCPKWCKLPPRKVHATTQAKPRSSILRQLCAFLVLYCALFLTACSTDHPTFKGMLYYLGQKHDLSCIETEACKDDGQRHLVCTVVKE